MKRSTSKVLVLMKLWVFAFGLLSLPAEAFTSDRNCAGSFDSSESGQRSAIYKALENFVQTNSKLPNLTELAQAADISVRALSAQLDGESPKAKVENLLEQGMEEGALKKIAADRTKVLKSFASYLERHLALPGKDSSKFEWDHQQASVFFEDGEAMWDALLNEQHTLALKVEKKILQVYAEHSRSLGRTLSIQELAAELRLEKDALSWIFDKADLFENELALVEQAKMAFPKHFTDVLDLNIFNEERTQKLVNDIQKKKRLVVTTAVSGAKVDLTFLASIERYCKLNDAALVVIPANMTTNSLDPVLLDKDWIHVLTNEIELSPFLRISNIKITAKQYDPLTSLDNVGLRSQSVIVGSPKMFQRVVATVNNTKHPHMLMSTGAITTQNYAGRKHIQQRGDYIAKGRHILGAVILERINADVAEADPEANPYHARHIEFIPKHEGFFDINRFYTADADQVLRPESMALGDLHVAKLDRVAFARVKEDIKRLKPKRIVLHDILDGETINHHEAEKQLARAQAARTGKYNLSEELSEVVGVLNELLALDESIEIVVVRSNHDLWLDRWLESGVFMKDPHNQAVGALLANAVALRHVENPLEYAVKEMGSDALAKQVFSATLTDKKRVRFLGLGEKYSPETAGAQVEFGLHGHAGVNGSKLLSLKSLERSVDRGIMAHTHTIGRRNYVVNVGTLTELELTYNRDGISNWVQSVAVVGPYGEIQLLNFNGNRFYATDRNRKSANSFKKGFPVVVPNTVSESGDGQVDQYGE